MAKKQESSAVVEYDWDQHNGATGLENLSQQDLGLPILNIVQKGSAEFDEDHEDHALKKIEGCKVGDIFNTVTRQILHQAGGEPLKVIPFFYKMVYVEWRESGGIAATHTNPAILNQCVRNDKNQDVLPNGNIVVTTAYYMVRLEDGSEALITMSSTQLKKSKVWLNMMKNFRGGNGNTLPMFHRPYYLSTVAESNDKGTWRGWKVEAGPHPLQDAEVIKALALAAQSVQGNTALLGNSQGDVDVV